MSKRDEGLLLDSLANRWSSRSAPAAGTTAQANVSAAFPAAQLTAKLRHNVTSFSFSVANTTAAAATVTGKITDASIGGSVLADWDFIVGVGAAVQGTFANLDIPGIRGNDVVASITPPASSVVAKVAVAGWSDTMTNG